MNFNNFKKAVENINSDVYLILYLFMIMKKPFTQEAINCFYQGKDSSPKLENSIIIAAPTKTQLFLPYKIFRKLLYPIPKVVEKPVEEEEPVINIGIEKKKQPEEIKKPEILLGDELLKKFLIPRKLGELKLYEKALEIKPKYEKNIITKSLELRKKRNKTKKNVTQIQKEEQKILESDDEYDEQIEIINEFEGDVNKMNKDKLVNLWCKLINKDLFFYENKQGQHKEMLNLSGVFTKEEENKNINDKDYKAFSLVLPTKTITLYFDNEENYSKWLNEIHKAINYKKLEDEYEISKELGSGKFGLVKLGINKETKQEVAVKIMDKKAMDTKDTELIITEIEIMRILDLPNIVKLYDVFEDLDNIYIVMEFCPYGDLFTYLEKRKFSLSEDRCREIIYKLCHSICFIHKYGIVHRDLKPENILMTGEDDNADLRLMDFGLSKIIGYGEKCTEPFGTVTYSSPEIITDQPYDKAVDLWAVGVMTYLMLSGKLPFNSNDETIICKKINDEKPDMVHNPIWNQISNDAKDFIRKLLEKAANLRMTMQQSLEHPWLKKYENKMKELRETQLLKEKQAKKDNNNNTQVDKKKTKNDQKIKKAEPKKKKLPNSKK